MSRIDELKFRERLYWRKEIGDAPTIYVCGPTVYDHIHLGNFRTFYFFWILHRYLMWIGMPATLNFNLTDIDDKIIAQSVARSVHPSLVAMENSERFFDLVKATGMESEFASFSFATDYIPQMQSLINNLMSKNLAYLSEDGVYCRVNKNNYFRFRSESHVCQKDDFVLWKSDKRFYWSSPWGDGRPGWHLECAAMASSFSEGEVLSVHGGGEDLCFPHHENEEYIIQSAFGHSLARKWLRVGFLKDIHGMKMSKSEGNFVYAKDAIAQFDHSLWKLTFLSASFFKPMVINSNSLFSAQRQRSKMLRVSPGKDYTIDKVMLCMRDFNLPKILGMMLSMTSEHSESLFAIKSFVRNVLVIEL